MKNKLLIVIIAAFVISIVARAPHLTRPLGINGENASAHVLITLLSFDQHPFDEHNYLPIYQFAGAANTGINNMPPSSITTSAGNHIYVSFPPLGYLLPYAFIKALALPVNEFSLRLFNLSLHAGFFLLLLKLFAEVAPAVNRSRHVAAAGIIFFAPVVMWNFSNSYWMHSPAQIFFLGALIFWVRLKKNGGTANVIGFLGTSLLLCLTEWFGYLFCAGVILWELLESRKPYPNRTAALSLASVVAALGLTAIHFASMLNLADVIQVLASRAEYRSTFTFQSVQRTLFMYTFGFGPLLVLPFLVSKRDFIGNRGLFFVAGFPVIESFLLSTHTQSYSYATLKLSALLAIAAVFAVNRLNRRIISYCAVNIAICLALFQYVNSPFWRPYFEEVHQKPGTFIRNHLEPDEMAFTNQLLGHVVYYSKRNIVFDCPDTDCLTENMARRKLTKGKYFVMRKRGFTGFDIVKLPYFFGFHNGVVESYVVLDTSPKSGLTRTAADLNNNGFVNGYHRAHAKLAVSKTLQHFDFQLEAGKAIKTDAGEICDIRRVEENQNFYFLNIASNCHADGRQLSFPNVFTLLER